MLFETTASDFEHDLLRSGLGGNCGLPQLDSGEEREFYEKLLPDMLGADYGRWVLPQVEVAALAPSGAANLVHQSVDFLVCKPPTLKVVIEIDGEQHARQWDLDEARDAVLVKHGYTVFRIPASEVRLGHGEKLDELRGYLKPHCSTDAPHLTRSSLERLVLATRYVHTIQVALLQAIHVGFLPLTPPWRVTTDSEDCGVFNSSEAERLLDLAGEGLRSLLSRLLSLYREEDVSGTASGQVHLSFFGHGNPATNVMDISSVYVPFDISSESVPTTNAALTSPQLDDIRYFLQYLFRKDEFWEGQAESIRRVLEGKDALVLLPTGAGKSIVFQLAAMLLPGCAVVVAPILSLIDDQIENLKAYGIGRVGKITSQLHAPAREAMTNLVGQGHFLICYVAPERFQTEPFREALRGLTVHTPIALIAVDEAHCVSEWGHDFRPAYLNIGRTAREYCSQRNISPPLIGLTGTASRAVLRDVQRELQITDFDALITPKSFDRKELRYVRIECSSSEKSARLAGLLGQLLPRESGETAAAFFQLRGDYTKCGLVFCPHVNGEYGVSQVADGISATLGVPASFYSGSPPKGMFGAAYDDHKYRTARDFKRNKLSLLVATKAFGMGIDKPNVRYTVHLGLPSSIESFYQEAGRAGRDGRKATCAILVSDDDPDRTRWLLGPNTDIEDVAKYIDSVKRDDTDDITRALFFHVNAFRGVQHELDEIQGVMDLLGDVSKRRRTTLRVRDGDLRTTEKAIHRLLVIGVVDDYTLDYSARTFSVFLSGKSQDQIITAYTAYLSGYLKAKIKPEERKTRELVGRGSRDFVLGICDLLLRFVYEVIEKGRRAALWEMLAACKNEQTEDDFRARILRYLEATQYSEDVEKILAQDDAGIALLPELFDNVASPNQAAELRGQVGRYLESYPDHPSILMLRSLSELYTRNADSKLAREHFLASLSSLKRGYDADETTWNRFVTWALSRVIERDRMLCEDLLGQILERWGSRGFAREVLAAMPGAMLPLTQWYLIARIASRVDTFLK